MEQLVIMQDSEAVTSTMKVAEVFGKRHDHVMRDVRNLNTEDVPNFGEMFFKTTESDSYGRDRKIYLMNRDGFTLLAMGFTGKNAMKFKLEYINEFNKKEEENKQLANDNTQLHQIATSEDDQAARQYQADKVRYSWKNIRKVLENSDYKSIEDEVNKIIDFHSNDLKKKDRANYDSHRNANKTEYKQMVRDRIHEVLTDIYNTTLDGTLRAVSSDIKENLLSNKLSTVNRSTSQIETNLKKQYKSVREPELSEYHKINYHPFSLNYMYQAVTDRLDNPLKVKTPRYKNWINKFPLKQMPDLNELGIDLNKPIKLYLAFKAKPEFDLDNLQKAVQDYIFNYYNIDDNLVHQRAPIKRVGYVDTYGKGAIYFKLENI